MLRDGNVADVQLRIYEPPRFFEALLRGRGYTEPPDITSRICGICPVAYEMSACNAIEDACRVRVPEEIRLMRRLLYCGEWIESHTLHVYMLHAPDFLGYPGVIEMAKDHRDVVERALRLKKAGNALMALVGGRAVHPVNVKVGGFYRFPDRNELLALRPQLAQALDDALATAALVAGFEFPDFEQPYEYLSLRTEREYPLESGTFVTSGGQAFPVEAFDAWVTEEQVPHSHALHARLRDVGPVHRRSACAVLAQPRQAAAGGPHGSRCRRAGANLPQPVPIHSRPCRGDRRGVRGGPTHHRRLVRWGSALSGRAAALRGRSRGD